MTKIKGNRAYVLMGGRYILSEGTTNLSKVEYLTANQVERINNLLMAKRYINQEISLIKQCKSSYDEPEQKVSEPTDELILRSTISNRARHVFENLGFTKLSDIAKHPFSEWSNWRNMGDGTIEEIKKYLIKKGFVLNEK